MSDNENGWEIGQAFEPCGVEWDDRDDPTIPLGDGYSCRLGLGHVGPHQSGVMRWEK